MISFYSVIIFFVISLLATSFFKSNGLVRKLWLLSKMPGPKRYWILGNIPVLFYAKDNLYKYLISWGNKYPSIYSIVLPFIGVVIINSPEDIKQLISGENHMEKGLIYSFFKKWFRNNLVIHSAYNYQPKRKLMVSSFNKFSNFKRFLQIFQQESEKVIEKLATLNESCEIVSIIAEFTFKTVAECSFGAKINLENEKHKQYYDNINNLLTITMKRVLSPWFYLDFFYYNLTSSGREEERCIKEVHEFSETIFNETIQQKDFDINDPKWNNLLISSLVNGSRMGYFKTDEISQHLDGILVASVDLVSTTTAYLLLELSANKDLQNKVVNEIQLIFNTKENCTLTQLNELHFLDMCVKETLRKYPPFPTILRKTSEDISTSQGYLIPKDVDVAVSIISLHRSPEIYPKPDEFDPYRFLPEKVKTRDKFAYLPFSAGPRSCLGSKFAFLQVKVLALKILQNYIVLPVDSPNTLQFTLYTTLQPKNGVKLKFIKRQ